jgi:hypothetical protein
LEKSSIRSSPKEVGVGTGWPSLVQHLTRLGGAIDVATTVGKGSCP